MSARPHCSRAALIITAVLVGVGPRPALAQLSAAEFSNLSHRVSRGDTVFVTTHTAGEIRGRLVRLSPDAVVVATGAQEETIPFADIGWLEKRGDRLWNGALIGGGLLAFGMGAAAGASCSPDCGSMVPEGFASGFAIGAAFGALIDWVIPGRALVYGQRPTFHRVLTPGANSLAGLSSQLRAGDKISVHTARGADIVGRFVRASASSVTVAVADRQTELPGSEVTEVRQYRGGTHVKKGVLIGVTLGALMGSAACYRTEKPFPSNSGSGIPCGIGVLLGGAGGGAVGALIGGTTFGSTVVYRVAPVASAHRIAVVTSFVF